MRVICSIIQGVGFLVIFCLAWMYLTGLVGMSGSFRSWTVGIMAILNLAFFPAMWAWHDKVAGRPSKNSMWAFGRPESAE